MDYPKSKTKKGHNSVKILKMTTKFKSYLYVMTLYLSVKYEWFKSYWLEITIKTKSKKCEFPPFSNLTSIWWCLTLLLSFNEFYASFQKLSIGKQKCDNAYDDYDAA